MTELMTVQEVAELLGIQQDSVRQVLGRHGIRERRGYPRDQVERFRRTAYHPRPRARKTHREAQQ